MKNPASDLVDFLYQGKLQEASELILQNPEIVNAKIKVGYNKQAVESSPLHIILSKKLTEKFTAEIKFQAVQLLVKNKANLSDPHPITGRTAGSQIFKSADLINYYDDFREMQGYSRGELIPLKGYTADIRYIRLPEDPIKEELSTTSTITNAPTTNPTINLPTTTTQEHKPSPTQNKPAQKELIEPKKIYKIPGQNYVVPTSFMGCAFAISMFYIGTECYDLKSEYFGDRDSLILLNLLILAGLLGSFVGATLTSKLCTPKLVIESKLPDLSSLVS